MKPSMKPFPASLALVALLATGCAQRTASGGTPPSSRAHGLILKIDVGGGFVAPQTALRQVPSFALYADGRLIVPGPQIEIYPGPALPNLQVRSVSAEGIQAILAAAKEAGLLGPDRSYDTMRVADAPTTTFTLVQDGVTHTVSVQALGIDQPVPDMPADEAEARTKLSALQAKLGDLASWLPRGSLGEEAPFQTDELRAFVFPYQAPQDLMQKAVDWPLGSLAGFTPLASMADVRCGTVSGDDLLRVLPTVEQANELTPWLVDGQRWALVFRPLLPDESGCA